MSRDPLTPEELVCQMSREELLELLEELGMESTVKMADGIQSLVRELNSFEAAIDAVGGHPLARSKAA